MMLLYGPPQVMRCLMIKVQTAMQTEMYIVCILDGYMAHQIIAAREALRDRVGAFLGRNIIY